MRRSFTFLELILTVFILTIIGAFIGINAVDLFQKARYQKSIKLLQEEIEAIHLFALTYGSDMSLLLQKEDNNAWAIILEVNESALRHLNKKRIPLNEIVNISFYKEKAEKISSIQIASNGIIRPSGILQIEGKKEKHFLDLRHPFQMTLSRQIPIDLILAEVIRPVEISQN